MEMISNYTYLNQLLLSKINGEYKGLIEIKLEGSRLSGKTKSAELLGISAFFIAAKNKDIDIEFKMFRYEPNGAIETFNEALDIWDYLGMSRRNVNLSNKSIKVKHYECRALGYKSNTKKTAGKLGIERKITKQGRKRIVIVMIDEITEFKEQREVEFIYQAIGQCDISIECSNPWRPDH